MHFSLTLVLATIPFLTDGHRPIDHSNPALLTIRERQLKNEQEERPGDWIDQLTFTAIEVQTTLEEVVTDKSISHLWPPLALACFSVRFPLRFNFEDRDIRAIVRNQIEHMQLCTVATTGFEILLSTVGSEPLLAEAAMYAVDESETSTINYSQLIWTSTVFLMASVANMQARDVLATSMPAGQRWVPICTYKRSRAVISLQFQEAFKDSRIWMNHLLKVRDTDLMNAEYLWAGNNLAHRPAKRPNLDASFQHQDGEDGKEGDDDELSYHTPHPDELPESASDIAFLLGESDGPLPIPPANTEEGRPVHLLHDWTIFDARPSKVKDDGRALALALRMLGRRMVADDLASAKGPTGTGRKKDGVKQGAGGGILKELGYTED
ncbi:hypothetical protein BC826DRAFT_966892 [Russula brevipes]|nr:hypothetical protein BC826DRAFT_966892 [Russula brevipes]